VYCAFVITVSWIDLWLDLEPAFYQLNGTHNETVDKASKTPSCYILLNSELLPWFDAHKSFAELIARKHH
jgi:hypothetical protein